MGMVIGGIVGPCAARDKIILASNLMLSGMGMEWGDLS